MMNTILRRHTLLLALAATLPLAAQADGLPASLQGRVDAAKAKLVKLAADPAVLAATREANGRDLGGMNNGKWSDLGDADPAVKAYTASKISAQIGKWETADTDVNKLVLRDSKGNLIGASTRPLVFNNASRPSFSQPIKGQPWSASEIKPDPSTQLPSVQLGVPVLDAGKPIGVLHAAVSAQ